MRPIPPTLDALLDHAAAVLEIPREAVEAERSLGSQGADSLRLIELLAILDERHGLTVALGDLPPDISIAGLMRLVEGADPRAGQPPVAQQDEAAALPLTPMQQAYWMGRSQSLELGGLAMHGYIEFEGADVSPERLDRAWSQLLRRHPMLRATITPEGTQRIRPLTVTLPIEHLDWREVAPMQLAAWLAALRRQREQQMPDLGVRGPCQLTLVRLPAARSRLLVSLEGSCLDIRSMQVLLEELALGYQKPDVEWPTQALDFARFAAGRAERNRGVVPVPLGLPAGPDLPLRTQPRAITRPRIRRKESLLDARCVEALQAMALSLQASLPVVLMTAFAEVVATWSREPRFLLNVPTYNRHALAGHRDAHQVLGCFSSLALLAVDFSRFESFVDRVRRVRTGLSTALDPARPDGVLVLRELARRVGQPLANPAPVVFTCAPFPRAGERPVHNAERVFGEMIHRASQTPQTWLDCQIWPHQGQLAVSWDYVDGLFPDGLIDDLFRAYVDRLMRLAADEAERDERSPDLRPAWQLQRLRELNDTHGPGGGESLLAPVRRHAHERAMEPAVACGVEHLSYAALWEAAGSLAARLRRHGAGKGARVSIEVPYGWRQLVAVLAVLRAEAAWLPLDPRWPQARRQQLLLAAEAGWCIAPGHGGSDLRVRRRSGEAAVEQVPGLAYVMFTSGSTGVPKGVLMSHAAAANTVCDINHRFGLGRDDVWLGLAEPSFDLAVYDLFGALFAGGRLVLPEPGASRDAVAWLDLIDSEGVTVLNVVPQMAEMLVTAGERQSRQWLTPRLILVSGDWVPPGLPERLRKIFPQVQVVALGGATEAGIWSLCQPVAREWPVNERIPYGRPLANQTVRIVKGDGMPAAFHVPGEILIGGQGLAHGYAGDPAASQRAFIHAMDSGERLYRTGDIGRFMADGSVELIGREDLRIKLRGHRIDPAEIEAAMLEHEAVEDAVVMVCHAGTGREMLICFVRMAADEMADSAALREHARARLPLHMVPAGFEPLEAWPLTANGKVDRGQLRRLADDWVERVRAYEPPATDIERRLQTVVHEVAGMERIGVNDDLLALGLSSIVAVQIQVRIVEALGRDIGSIDLFSHNSIRRIASWLEAEAGRAPSS